MRGDGHYEIVGLGQHEPILLIYAGVFVLSLGLFALVRRGRIQLAGTGFLLVLWTAITLGVLTYGGIRSPSAGGYILVVIISTLLFSGRLVLAFLALSLATLAAIVAVEFAGALPPQLTPDTPQVAFIAHFIHLISAGFFLYLAVKNLQEARQRARRGAAPGARLAVLTHEVRLMERCLDQARGLWTPEGVTRVYQKGHHPRIYLLRPAGQAPGRSRPAGRGGPRRPGRRTGRARPRPGAP